MTEIMLMTVLGTVTLALALVVDLAALVGWCWRPRR